MNGVSELKRDVISACRILCEQKLVEGFGHVSARLPDSESFLLTPRISPVSYTHLTLPTNREV